MTMMAFLGLRVRAKRPNLFSYRLQVQSLHLSSSKYNRATAVEETSKLKVNDRLHGYTVNSVEAIADFNLTAVCLTHDITGAQHLHLARKDSNNTFSVGFPTTPMDSTGVAHILEHTTLCGSKKYPVRDPFFKMLTRSLSTFMNAFTASDWTMYPFSTQNEKDYRNLLSVYLDCVFFPQLKELDFKQEGWRLEHEDPRDCNSPIVFKGVVYNEMKGCFANSEMLFAQALQNNLYPSHTYSHVSGGKPINIVDLTWESLKDFHANHYHPSNGRFFTYGDIPLAYHLGYISDNVLKSFKRVPLTCGVPQEPRWSHPRDGVISCPPDPMAADPSKQTTVAISFLLSSITDPYESLVLSILSQLLVDGPASPFYQALIDSNIGSDYSPMTGYDGSTKEASFSIGLQGISEGDVSRVTEIIWDTLDKVANEGFPSERIKAVLHQYELGLKHQRSNFGLAIISSLMSAWIHDGDPVSLMQVNENVEKFKKELESESGFLQQKVRQYFLDNQHNLTLRMSPDNDYENQMKCAEKEKLKKFVSALSDEDKVRVYEQGLQLLQEQNSVTNAECLPTLLISDVERSLVYDTLDHEFAGGVPVQYAAQPTNGVTYFKAVSGLSHLPEEIKMFVPLFCFIVTRMGAGDLDYRQFSQQCDLYTGGLSSSPYVSAHHTMSNGCDQGIIFASHCNDRHVPHMFSLWEDIFTKPNFQDAERLHTLITMLSSNLATSIADSGHKYAMMSASASLSPAAQLTEMFNGLTQVEFLKHLATKEELSDVINTLMSIAVEVLDSGSLRCAVNCTHDNMSTTQIAMEGFIDSLPKSRTDAPDSYTEVLGFQSASTNTYYQMPFPVHYVGQSFRTVPFSHEDAPRLQVLGKLMASRFLHKEIREKGGAYGSGARQEAGIFSFMSYRDPNSSSTLDVFRKCAEWVCEGKYSEKDIEEAKLSVFSQIDAPVSPGNIGSRIFLNGISNKLNDSYRNKIFETTGKDLIAAAEKYILDNKCKSAVIIGPDLGENKIDWIVRKFEI